MRGALWVDYHSPMYRKMISGNKIAASCRPQLKGSVQKRGQVQLFAVTLQNAEQSSYLVNNRWPHHLGNPTLVVTSVNCCLHSGVVL